MNDSIRKDKDIKQIDSPLPPLYSKWAYELLSGTFPNETVCDCSNCEQLDKNGVLPLNDNSNFHPETKCCTFYPALPNYMVGRILKDSDIPAMPVVNQRIENGFGITPLYLLCPDNDRRFEKVNFFGRTKAFTCPYYIVNKGCCGIWKHRGSICATWFCKYFRGKVGYDFWDSIKGIFLMIEETISLWCAEQLDIGCDSMEQCLKIGCILKDGPLEQDMRIDSREQKKNWGNWFGKEKEYFIKCGELVESLSWKDIKKIGGIKLETYAKIVKKYYDRLLNKNILERLKFGGLHIFEVKSGYYIISIYNDYDRIEIPIPIFEALRYFDGRPINEIMAQIKKEKNISFDDSLLQFCIDFKLLITV